MEGAKKILLHSWHSANAVRMADFGGYDMPLWYQTGPKEEHLAVLRSAGLFDTSHMAVVTLQGPDSFALLQATFSKDLAQCIGPKRLPLCPGRCVYGVFADENGYVIDDALVYHLADEHYMVVVNAGMGPVLTEHLQAYAARYPFSGSTFTDFSDSLSKFDVQGPAALKILRAVLADPDAVFATMPYFSFKGFFDPSSSLSKAVTLQDGTPILLSRTGYTGEFGFELFLDTGFGEKVWHALLEAGDPYGMTVCGLAARDSLRAGAVLPLSHQDIGHWPFVNTPWPFALPYTEDGSFSKEFLGSKAIIAAGDADHTYAFVGKDVRKVVAGEGSSVQGDNGESIGTVLTCATDMGIGWHEGKLISVATPDLPEGVKIKGLCCGFIKVSHALAPGQKIMINDTRRSIEVTVVTDIRPDRTARRAIGAMA